MSIGAGRHDHRLQQLEAAPLAGLAAQALHRLALGRRCTARPARVLPGLPGQGSHAGQGTVLECLPAQLAAATGAHQQPQGAAAQQALDVQPRATALPGGALAATAQLAREAIEHALDIQAGTTLAPAAALAARLATGLLMQQAGGQSGRQGGSGSQGGSGLDIKGMLDGLSRQLGGGGEGAAGQGGGSGLDVKSLLGGGALGLLVGSRRGRKLGGKALKYGALAGVGALAWKAWQNSRGAGGASPTEGEPVERLGGEARERRSLELLQAMIMAARADGHIDDQERALITQQIDALGADQELHAWVERQLAAPLDAEALARQVDSPQAAREMYLISVAVVDEQNAMERAWLDQLGRALALPGEVVTELERQAREAG